MNKILLFATVILMDILVGMEFDLFAPSFPELEQVFDLTPFWVEATLSINFVGFCTSLFFVGDLADRFGRRPVIIAGLSLFVLGSLFCLYAPHFSFLLLGRFLQGIGIAAPAILSFLLIADSFSLHKQQFYLAILNGVMNVSCALAPILGSYITLYYHWEGNFFTLLALGAVVCAMTIFSVPKSVHSEKETGSYRAIFCSKPLMLLIAQISFMFVPWWIFVGISPLLYMEDLGVPLAHFGFYQGGLALVFAMGSLFYGFVMDKLDRKKMLIVSNIIFIASLFALGYISFIDCKDAMVISTTFLLFIIGQIVPTTILFPLALNWLPEAKGRAAALIQGSRLILSSFGLQLAGLYYTGSFQHIGSILLVFIAATSAALYFVIKELHYKIAQTS